MVRLDEPADNGPVRSSTQLGIVFEVIVDFQLLGSAHGRPDRVMPESGLNLTVRIVGLEVHLEET